MPTTGPRDWGRPRCGHGGSSVAPGAGGGLRWLAGFPQKCNDHLSQRHSKILHTVLIVVSQCPKREQP